MMIHKCRACGWPIEYPEFMAGSPGKCDECGEMQRLGQRPEDPPEIGPQPEVSKAKNIFATVAAAVIVLGPIVLCVGLCSGLGGEDTKPIDQRVIGEDLMGFDLTRANSFIKDADAAGVSYVFDRAFVYSGGANVFTNQKWSRLTKAEKIKTVNAYIKIWRDIEIASGRPLSGRLLIVGFDANRNRSLLFDSLTNEIWVND